LHEGVLGRIYHDAVARSVVLIPMSPTIMAIVDVYRWMRNSWAHPSSSRQFMDGRGGEISRLYGLRSRRTPRPIAAAI
jgi:hypothetical protein